jgi:predicted tellurium resistance membrane protein TerC
LAYLASLTSVLFYCQGEDFTGRDIVLILGGVFLIYKATKEIHEKTTGEESELHEANSRRVPSLNTIVFQIVLIDIIFSLDSVITAVGMTNNLPVMAMAIILAVIAMLIFSGGIVNFIEKNPTVKMLALAFLLMIGFILVVDGFGHTVDKGYIYFAMGFSLFVEMLNIRAAKRRAEEKLLNQ